MVYLFKLQVIESRFHFPTLPIWYNCLTPGNFWTLKIINLASNYLFSNATNYNSTLLNANITALFYLFITELTNCQYLTVSNSSFNCPLAPLTHSSLKSKLCLPVRFTWFYIYFTDIWTTLSSATCLVTIIGKNRQFDAKRIIFRVQKFPSCTK